MGEVFLDSFLDTLKVLPFLFVIYLLIELLEHKTTLTGNRKILQGKWAPLIGSAAGIIPLCGFSVMAAKLYDRHYIRTGTLLAVFIATSDEAVIVLASDFSVRSLIAMLVLLAIKFVLAIAVGYAANALLPREKSHEVLPDDSSAEYNCGHERHGSAWELYFFTPLWHALRIALYLFIVNLVFGIIIFFAGEQTIASSLGVHPCLQPLIAAAVGLIPSCASSVILTGAFLHGGIEFGSMVAGLVVNAGMGFVVLLKNVAETKRNIALLASLYVIACIAGIAINLIAPIIV